MTGAACAIMDCGAKLNDFELKMHNGRKNRALKITKNRPVVRAICSTHFKEVIAGKSLKWGGKSGEELIWFATGQPELVEV